MKRLALNNFSPFAWALRNDAETVAEAIQDETREEWQIQLAALLALAED